MMNDDSQATDFTSQRVTVDVFCLSEVSLSEAQTTITPITHEDHLISVCIPEPVSRLPQVSEGKEQITGSQADNMNNVRIRQRAKDQLAGPFEMTLFSNFLSSLYHATWPS